MLRSMCLAYTALVLPLLVSAGHADISLRFIEGAPKDRFEIKNEGACALSASTITLDLSTSQGALIFDVTNRGAGVEVFQPFEIVAGKGAFASMPTIVDGQNTVDLPVSTLSPGVSIAFTIDVDDTRGAREITVTGSEISGAVVRLTGDAGQQTALFGSDATASVPRLSC